MQIRNQLVAKKGDHSRNVDRSTESKGFISIYDTHPQAEAGITELQRAGFDMKKLSIIGRDYQNQENVIGYYNMGDRTKYWGKMGAFWGSLWGMLFGSALFIIPGIGPLVVAGSFVATIVAAIEGAALIGGLSALGAAFYSLGIPKNSIVQYESDLKAGKYIMVAHGTAEDLRKAREIAANTGAQNGTDFDCKDAAFESKKMNH
jgi:hypothetical protein